MPKGTSATIYLSDDEIAIANAIAKRTGTSRSNVFRHLLLHAGLCGGDFPLTTRILGQPDADRDRLIGEIRKRAESNDPIKPQSFKIWIKEVLGSDDPATIEKGVDILVRKLLAGD